MIKGRHIVLGVSGGIAVYKTATLASHLTQLGADVHVVMTRNACQFVTPLTFETLTHNRVVVDTFSREAPYEVTHVSLGQLAELLVVAPATANILAKAAHGLADDFLSTLFLTVQCPIFFAPAMNTAMYQNPVVKENLKIVASRGARILSPGKGVLACGDVGEGRMSEPEELEQAIVSYFASKQDLKGLRLLVTAGPTIEPIDDVRYLTNRSSGKMGYAIAKAAQMRGAEVTLVSGKTALLPPDGVRLIPVTTAEEMFHAVEGEFAGADIVVKAAAVADYTPREKLSGKLKKGGDLLLELVRTQDILMELGSRKQDQILVGFAAEAEDLEANALAKLEKKGLDLIAANDISRDDIGFGSEYNHMTLFFADGRREMVEKAPKEDVANRILDAALELYQKKHA